MKKTTLLLLVLLPVLIHASKEIRFPEPFPLTDTGWKNPWSATQDVNSITLKLTHKNNVSYKYSTLSYTIKNISTPLTAEKEFSSDGIVKVRITGKTNGLPLFLVEGKIKTVVPEFMQQETYALTPQNKIRHFRSGRLTVKVGPLKFDFIFKNRERSDEYPAAPIRLGHTWRNYEKTGYTDSKGKGISLTVISNYRTLVSVSTEGKKRTAFILIQSKTHDYSTIAGGPPRKNKDPNRYSISLGWTLFDIDDGAIIKTVINKIPVEKTDYDSFKPSTPDNIRLFDGLLKKATAGEDPIFISQDIVTQTYIQ